MIALILKGRWLYLIVVILVHGTVAPSSLSQVSTSPVNRWSDSCVSSSFVGTINVINSQYSFSGFSQVHDYTNDDVIAIGSIRPNLPPTNLYKVYGLIMRISKTGIVKWTKFVGIRDSPYDSDTRFNVSVVTKNREIVVVGSTAIFRFDGDGNVVWQQKTPYFRSRHVYQQIIETSHGCFF